MPRTITFEEDFPYQSTRWDGAVDHRPEVIAEFRLAGGKPLAVPAILDTGAPMCCIPRAVAIRLGVDVASCSTRPTRGIEGRAEPTPYVSMYVKVLGEERECDVLLIAADLFLVGRDPFFSVFQFAFYQEPNPDNNRVLYSLK